MANIKKQRVPIPSDLAAKVQFLGDRTCCICRAPGKPTQIHHIDDNPANNDIDNLVVLCLDHHNETQIKGGFGRHLDSEQIFLYRSDWYEIVASQRAISVASDAMTRESENLEYITAMAEAYRDGENWSGLASFYNQIGNRQLRDKYIEKALAEDVSDYDIVYLRSLQRRPDLIPKSVVHRESERYTADENWSQRARMWFGLNEPLSAAKDYLHSIADSLDNGNLFSAAFYLKELLNRGLVEDLFVLALKEAEEQGDLWWQVRALQELNWTEELHQLVIKNKEQILNEKQPFLLRELIAAEGNTYDANELWISMIRNSKASQGIIRFQSDSKPASKKQAKSKSTKSRSG